MVLLSPMVTAMTQMWMWLRNRRTRYLQQMLVRLLKQIDGPQFVRLEVLTGGARQAGTVLTTAAGTVLGTTDANGYVVLASGLPEADASAGTLSITAANAAGAVTQLTARYIPQHSFDDIQVS